MDRNLTHWAELLVQSFTRYPDDLQIVGTGNHVSIKPHRADYGKIIGKASKNITALKTILSQIQGFEVELTVLEPSIGTLEEPEPFLPDRRWTKPKEASLHSLLSRICTAMFHSVEVELKGNVSDMSEFRVITTQMTPELESAIYTIFRAIGNCRGRKVTVEGRCA